MKSLLVELESFVFVLVFAIAFVCVFDCLLSFLSFALCFFVLVYVFAFGFVFVFDFAFAFVLALVLALAFVLAFALALVVIVVFPLSAFSLYWLFLSLTLHHLLLFLTGILNSSILNPISTTTMENRVDSKPVTENRIGSKQNWTPEVLFCLCLCLRPCPCP